MATQWEQYLSALRENFIKVSRLEFLQPDNSVAFKLDNNPYSRNSGAFIQEGQLSVNLQNGQRRSATVTLSNLDGAFDYNYNKVWFGTKVRLLMGLILPSGAEYFIPQGTFYIKDPEEYLDPNMKTAKYNLVDKAAILDGTIGGHLEGTYEITVGDNIFDSIQGIFDIDQGNGQVLDNVPPIFTNYYNDKTVTLPDGSSASMIVAPYTARFDGDSDTYWSVISGANDMLAGWIGYDAYGSFRLDPSQDDITDLNKPILWTFTPSEKQFLGATYTVKNTELFNSVIRTGESLDSYAQVGAKAENHDPLSDTNIELIGRKTDRQSKAGFYTNDVCAAQAEFDLKRSTVLKKSVSIRSTQMFHLIENNLVVIRRIDKAGAPYERHLVQGFTIPIGQKGEMTISAFSVQDYPIATVTTLSGS